ncbi:MAG TPA: MotA/TolQ/ExbB proton channel family protein [Actinomycetota bacterium]|nr:MotA/TolQ/ExbB proton channel family protein [Actinomycetota bacterium]
MNLRNLCAGVSAPARRWLPGATALLLLSTVAVAFQETPAPAASGGVELSVGGLIRDSGFIGWVIVALSIVAVALVLENLVSLKRDKLAPPELIDEVQALFDEEQFQEAMELCENEPNFFTRVCGAGISKIGHEFEVMEAAITEMGDEESIRLHQKIGWLALIANVAPMLGLLGTVWGMIIAFKQIADSGGQANPADLASGISVALLTTLFGLLVAIPTTAAFAYLRNNLVRSVIEVGAIVEDLFERFRPGHQQQAS